MRLATTQSSILASAAFLVAFQTFAAAPPSRVYSPEEIKLAEAHFADLLAAVRTGMHTPLDKRHPPSPLDQVNLVDCSHVDPRVLAAAAGSVSSQYIYNDGYTWRTVVRGETGYCVYLWPPLNRGLNAADASDFLMARQLRLGPEPADAPNLEHTLKVALARLGDDVVSTAEGLPADLIDCQDFSGSPQDNDENFSYGAEEWMFDGSYVWTYHYFPKGTCLVVSGGEDSRGTTAHEARAFLRAARAGVDDPVHAEAQRAQNCLAKATQSYGANIPAYESGTINGRRYRVFYAALDPDLKPLDDAQHAFVASRKQLWRQSAPVTAHNVEGAFDIEIRIRPTGRTKRLATLNAWEASPGSSSPRALVRDWMLHVSSGRLLTFEDLFVDPKLAHEQVVARYLRGVPHYLDYVMSSLAFLGDDAEQQANDFRARYLEESHRIATTPTEHFPGVSIAADGQRMPYIFGEFSSEVLPDRSPPTWSAELKDLQPYFKPEFRDVLDGIHCSQVPTP